MDIEAWFGIGDGDRIGPLTAELVGDPQADGTATIRITDPAWAERMGLDLEEDADLLTHREVDCIGPKTYVGYDSYAWCPKGEGGDPPGNWWKK